MDINGAINCLTHGRQHLELDITDGVDGIRAQHFQNLGRAGITVTCMSGNLEMAVGGNLSSLAHLIQRPQTALVIDQETTTAEASRSLHIFNRPHDLLLTAETVTHADTFLSVNGGRGICGSAGTDGKDQVGLILVSQIHHLGDIFICQAHDTLGLGHAVQIQAIGVNRLQQSLHDLRPLDAGNLEAILAAISEAFLARRQIVSIATRLSDGT